MRRHIDADGRFQSDKYPDLAPDKIVLSFRDPAARKALLHFSWMTDVEELALDLLERVCVIDWEENS